MDQLVAPPDGHTGRARAAEGAVGRQCNEGAGRDLERVPRLSVADDEFVAGGHTCSAVHGERHGLAGVRAHDVGGEVLPLDLLPPEELSAGEAVAAGVLVRMQAGESVVVERVIIQDAGAQDKAGALQVDARAVGQGLNAGNAMSRVATVAGAVQQDEVAVEPTIVRKLLAGLQDGLGTIRAADRPAYAGLIAREANVAEGEAARRGEMNGRWLPAGEADVGEAALLMKTAPNGVERWSRTYGAGSTTRSVASAVIEPAFGGFCFAGAQHHDSTRDWSVYVVRTDAAGSLGGPLPVVP